MSAITPYAAAVARLRAAEEVWSRTNSGSYELEAAYQSGYPNGPSAEARAAYEEASTRYWQALTEVVEARKVVTRMRREAVPSFEALLADPTFQVPEVVVPHRYLPAEKVAPDVKIYPHPAPSDTAGRCGCAACHPA